MNRYPTAKMPSATTPTNTAMSRTRQHLAQDDHLWQRQRNDGHHEGEHRTKRRALAHQRLDDRDDASSIRIHRDADQNGRRHRPPGVLAHDRGQQFGRHIAVDEGADRDAGDDPEPDPADDIAHRLDPGLDSVDDRPRVRQRSTASPADVTDPFLEPAFEMQPADDPAGDDGNGQAECRDRSAPPSIRPGLTAGRARPR